jgi:hypothetical protein
MSSETASANTSTYGGTAVPVLGIVRAPTDTAVKQTRTEPAESTPDTTQATTQHRAETAWTHSRLNLVITPTPSRSQSRNPSPSRSGTSRNHEV